MNPLLAALRELGGSATNEEMAAKVVQILNLPNEIAERPHGRGSMTEVEYRLHWARSYLKATGLLENPRRKVWALTARGRAAEQVDPKAIARDARALRKAAKAAVSTPEDVGTPDNEEVEDWRSALREALLRMPPDAFERLCQRLLRECGFTEVEVTGRSGDGGIDGHGIIRLAGLISFNVIFQAKRYQGKIGSSTVRDFRGAMVGRADKGVIITTSGFTRDARQEATRDGAPPIDLLNGDDLMDMLKDFGLGVKVTTRTVEDVDVQPEWFAGL